MPQQYNLRAAVANDNALKEQLLGLYPSMAEDNQALLDTLDGISDLDEQIFAAMRVALEREAYAEGLGEHINRLLERKARLKKGAEAIRSAVLHAMTEASRIRLTAPDMTLSALPGRPGVQIIDESRLPDDLVVTTRRPDMKAINAAVKEGREVPGTAPKNPQPFLTCRVA